MSDSFPAYLGGTPICPEGPPAWPMPDDEVASAIRAALADGSWGLYHGPHLPKLEETLATTFGNSQAIACASGTLAVEIALRAVGVGPGDEVILGGYDYEPSFLAIHAVGAVPVLIDVRSDNVCLEAERIADAVSPKTRAILATHLHGGLADMPRIASIAKERNLRVIEDAAQVPGANFSGRPAGSWGDLGVLSFGGSKLLTASRGGAILASSPELAQRVRLLLSRGVQQWGAMGELQAVALLPQLTRLAERTTHRQRMVERLVQSLSDVPELRPFAFGSSAYYKVGWFVEGSSISRDRFVQALRAEGIAFDAGFRALHVGRSPSRYRAAGSLANAEFAGRSVVILHHPVLSLGEADVDQVAMAVRKTYRNASHFR